jgi:DNA-directed RNA polymerase subunit M/transcription elongation factor TFIIS
MSLTREQIIERLQPVIDSCQEALDGGWDKSDDGFIAMEEILQSLSDDLQKEQEFLEYQGINETDKNDYTCPKCKSVDIAFDYMEIGTDDSFSYRWVTCKDCGFQGRVYYKMAFDGWEDEDGNPA